MRRILIVGIVALVMTSCLNEEFQTIDTSAMNREIKGRIGVSTPEQLINIILPDSLKGEYKNESITSSLTIGNNRFEVTKVITINDDDELAGEKYVLVVTRFPTGEWKVLSAKKNWKCREGRCHTNWGI